MMRGNGIGGKVQRACLWWAGWWNACAVSGVPPVCSSRPIRRTTPWTSAALDFYTIFSIAPMPVVVIAVAGLLAGPAAAYG
jgi:hypothetical protein